MTKGLHTISLVGMVAGIGGMVQPWWVHGFRVGFFLTLAATVLYIVTAHMLDAEPK